MTQAYSNPVARLRMTDELCPECGAAPEEHSGLGRAGCMLTDTGVADRIAHHHESGDPMSTTTGTHDITIFKHKSSGLLALCQEVVEYAAEHSDSIDPDSGVMSQTVDQYRITFDRAARDRHGKVVTKGAIVLYDADQAHEVEIVGAGQNLRLRSVPTGSISSWIDAADVTLLPGLAARR